MQGLRPKCLSVYCKLPAVVATLGGLEIDNELVLVGCSIRRMPGCVPLRILSTYCAARRDITFGTVRHQATRLHEVERRVVLSCKRSNLASVCNKQRIAEHQECLGLSSRLADSSFQRFRFAHRKDPQLQPPRALKSANTRHGKARNDRARCGRTTHLPERSSSSPS